jgi:hypothetical protein
MKNQRKFMEWAGKQFNVKEMSDWYKITSNVRIAANYLVYVVKGHKWSWRELTFEKIQLLAISFTVCCVS